MCNVIYILITFDHRFKSVSQAFFLCILRETRFYQKAQNSIFSFISMEFKMSPKITGLHSFVCFQFSEHSNFWKIAFPIFQNVKHLLVFQFSNFISSIYRNSNAWYFWRKGTLWFLKYSSVIIWWTKCVVAFFTEKIIKQGKKVFKSYSDPMCFLFLFAGIAGKWQS